MINDIPKTKTCPICKEEKAADFFGKDRQKKDGLSYVCKACTKTYLASPRRKKTDLSNYTKTCIFCNRTLSSRWFHYVNYTEDKLEKKCRTCRNWKSKNSPPTLEEILEHEKKFERILTEAIRGLMIDYYIDDPHEVIKQHRSQLEQMVHLAYLRECDTTLWGPPAWIHKSSLSDFMNSYE